MNLDDDLKKYKYTNNFKKVIHIVAYQKYNTCQFFRWASRAQHQPKNGNWWTGFL